VQRCKISYCSIGANTKLDIDGMYTGYISEILVYNSSLFNSSYRQQIEGYLSWKWGLQANLPSGHPYKGGPPSN